MADYNCGAYGAGNFGQGECSQSGSDGGTDTGAGAGTGNGVGTGTSQGQPGGVAGVLANTGYEVLLPVAFALAVLMAASVVLVKRLVRRKRNAAPAE